MKGYIWTKLLPQLMNIILITLNSLTMNYKTKEFKMITWLFNLKFCYKIYKIHQNYFNYIKPGINKKKKFVNEFLECSS